MRKNSPIPWNSSIDTGTRVFAQLEEKIMYNPSKSTFNQYDIPIASAAPMFSSPNFNTSAQEITMWKQMVAQELMSKGLVKLCT